MTSVQTPTNISFTRPVRPFAPPRKNSMMSASAAAPVLSTFAIDLIAQFDNYRVNMRESLQREVEENIHKAKVLKEAMKESSDRDAEIMISEENEEYKKHNGGSTPNNRSNSSLNRLQGSPNSQSQSQYSNGNSHSGSKLAIPLEKLSKLDRFFGRKPSAVNNNSIRNHQVTPHPKPQTPSPSLRPSNTLTAHGNSSSHSNNSGQEMEIRYLPVEEESEDDAPHVVTGTEVKLHPTRAKTFALPKSLKNLKRRIAALRARGTDLDAEKREREERERAANGGVAPEEKKKFTLIRLLPWRSNKTTAAPATTAKRPTDSVISPSNTLMTVA